MGTKIEDIARHAGVAVSTVSKALNGYRGVAEETRARVFAAAEELNYQPSASARHLRQQRTYKIGLMLNFPFSDVADYLSDLIAAASEVAEANGYNFVLYTRVGQHLDQLPRICRSGEVDAMVLMWIDRIDETIDLMRAENMPYLVMARRPQHPDACYVVTDNQAGARALTQHLIVNGHRRIGMFTFPEMRETHKDRLAGYLEAHEMAGLPIDPALQVDIVYPDAGKGGPMLGKLLQLADPPTALFAYHDQLAVEAQFYAQQRGLRVPEDIAIAGFDGVRITAVTSPPITTVQQPLREMGARLIEALLQMIANPDYDPVKLTFPPTLVVRGSTQAGA